MPTKLTGADWWTCLEFESSCTFWAQVNQTVGWTVIHSVGRNVFQTVCCTSNRQSVGLLVILSVGLYRYVGVSVKLLVGQFVVLQVGLWVGLLVRLVVRVSVWISVRLSLSLTVGPSVGLVSCLSVLQKLWENYKIGQNTHFWRYTVLRYLNQSQSRVVMPLLIYCD